MPLAGVGGVGGSNIWLPTGSGSSSVGSRAWPGSGGTSGGGGFGSRGSAPGSGAVQNPAAQGRENEPCTFYDKGKLIQGYWGRDGNSLRCMPQEQNDQDFFKFLKGGGGAGGGAPAANRPEAPNIEKPREIGGNIPELERMGQGYEQYLRNLESGAGYSADVLAGQTRDQTEAQIAAARQAAEQQGRPFDEESMRAELQRGRYGAQAQEKLGREKMLGEAYGRAPGVLGANEQARQGRWGIGQRGDLGYGGLQAGMYGTQAGMYGSELSAATSANNALLNFLGQLYGGMFNAMGNVSSNSYYG